MCVCVCVRVGIIVWSLVPALCTRAALPVVPTGRRLGGSSSAGPSSRPAPPRRTDADTRRTLAAHNLAVFGMAGEEPGGGSIINRI